MSLSLATDDLGERAHLLAPVEDDIHKVHTPVPLQPDQRRLIFFVGMTILAADFGHSLTLAPQISIYESLICLKASAGIDCKSTAAQSELALLLGWKETLDHLPGIILALPYGLAADRIGRKPILVMCLAGIVCEEIIIRLVCWFHLALPLRLIWVTPVFQLVGGGVQTALAMAYAMITDVAPAEQRAAIFYIMAAVLLVGEILATPISAWLMALSPWVPSLIGVVFQFGGLLSAIMVFETRPLGKASDDPAILVHDGFEAKACDDQLRAPFKSMISRMRQSFTKKRKELLETHLKSMDLTMLLIFSAFLLASISQQALLLIIPYASKRFLWSIPRASFLITLKGVINAVALLLVLPRLSIWLSRHLSWSSAIIDLRIVQISAWMLTVGIATMAFAAQPELFISGLCLFALGWGFYSALRSLATGWVSPSEVVVLNSMIGLTQGLGSLIAGPVMAAMFNHGLQQGGVAMGLPFVLAAGLLFVASLLTLEIRVGKRRHWEMT